MQLDNLWLKHPLCGYPWKFKKAKWFLYMHICFLSLTSASVCPGNQLLLILAQTSNN